MKSTVILISGKQGSGKTTLQRALQAELYKTKGNLVMRINFADELYKIHDFAVNRLKHFGVIDKKVVKDGKLLQILGTEWARLSINTNVWVDIVKSRIKTIEDLNKDHNGRCYFIIGDCRFKNEFDAFPDALKIRLIAPKEVRKNRAESWRDNDAHPSEIDLDEYEKAGKFDLVFTTDCTSTEEIVSVVTDITAGITQKERV